MEEQKLPNATAVLILGICSIVTCCCYGLGILLGIVGLVISKKDVALYNLNPTYYINYSNLKTGRILCIIGIILTAIYLLLIVWLVITFGWDTLQDQELLKQRMTDYLEN